MQHKADDVGEPWIDAETLTAVDVAARNGMPARSVGVYSRWWQLETWLRDLVYVELRAKYGAVWEGVVARAAGRQAQDAAFTHMENADSKNPLAYLDYSQILEVISAEWELFERTLMERRSWEGRQEDLKRIRHRIGHMRVPHDDDLSRLEQTLRDLERGAFIAFASYNRRFSTAGGADPITAAWLDGQHDDARRLLKHADRQYETRLLLQASRRPWVTTQPVVDPAPGILWHADFMMRGRTIDVAALWRDSALDRMRRLVVHLVADDPWHIGFTFSGADSASDIADAIGEAFDAVLMNSHQYGGTGVYPEDWARQARRPDYRVVIATGWNIVDESTVPISNFGAGGGVTQVPPW